jgi:hypothetical protein
MVVVALQHKKFWRKGGRESRETKVRKIQRLTWNPGSDVGKRNVHVGG